MSLNKFRLLGESSDHFHLQHPSGERLSVAKAKLSPVALQAIQGLADGGRVVNMPEDNGPDAFWNGRFPDTGRAASSPGERIDSLIGAPARAAISEAQQGNWSNVGPAAYQAFNADPQKTKVTSGPEILERAGVPREYGEPISKGLDVAQEMGFNYGVGSMGGVQGEIVDASKRFPKRNPPGARQKLNEAMALEKNPNAALDYNAPGFEYIENRFADRPELIKAARKLQGSDIPYLTNNDLKQSAPHTLPNFGYKIPESGEIGKPMIQHHQMNNTDHIDPFNWADDKHKVALTALQQAKKPVTVNTSSDAIARDRYIDAIPRGSKVNLWMLSDNDHLNRLLYPSNPSQARLEKAAEKLQEAGINVKKIYPTADEYIERAKAGNLRNDRNYIETMTGGTEENLREQLKGNMRPRLTPVQGKAYGGMMDDSDVSEREPASEVPAALSPQAPAPDLVSQTLQTPASQAFPLPSKEEALNQRVDQWVKNVWGDTSKFSPEQMADIKESATKDVLKRMAQENTTQTQQAGAEQAKAEEMNRLRQAAGLAPVEAQQQAQAMPQMAQFQQQAPGMPGMQDYNKIYGQQEQYLKDYLSGINASQAQQKQVMDEYQAQVAGRRTPEEIQADAEEKNQMLFDNVINNKIDPTRYFKNMSTGDKILAGIGVALGGMASHWTGGRNLAADQINQAINHDIMAQQNDQSSAMNLWKMNREKTHDDVQASLLTQNQMLTMAQAKVAMISQGMQNQAQKLQAQQLLGNLQQQRLQNTLMLSLMQSGQANSVDPAALIQYRIQNPEHQKTVAAEVDNAKTIAANRDKILKAQEDAIKDVGLMSAAGFKPGSVMKLHQMILPLFKDIDATVRQAAMDETFANVTPAFGDTVGNRTEQRREALKAWLDSKQQGSLAKSYGLDLQRFAATSSDPRMRFTPQQLQFYNWAMSRPVNDPERQATLKKLGVQ